MAYILIFVPFLILVLQNLLPKPWRLSGAFWLVFSFLFFQIMAVLVTPLAFWGRLIFAALEPVLAFNLFINGLSIILFLCAGMVGMTALFVAKATFTDEDKYFNFMNLLLIFLAGLNGIAAATDLFSLYVFIEVVSLASFILIVLNKDREGYEGVFKYLLLSVVASVLMLSSLGILLLFAPGTSFFAIGMSTYLFKGNLLMKMALLFFICGLFIKGGMVPFHGWLPDAYTSAPAAVSVLLGGIATKALGIFTLLKLLVGVIGFDPAFRLVLLAIGLLSIVIGALGALIQKDMKRMLAYSSISQMGYIVLALGTGTGLGVIAAVFHFINHAIFKTQLFVNAAAVEKQLGSRDMDEMGGLAGAMPITGTTAVIASLSTAGLPPLAGFWSKLLVIMALWSVGLYGYAVVALLASLLTLAYFLLMQRRVFFGTPSPRFAQLKEAPAALVVPAVCLAGLTVLIGVGFPFIMRFFLR